MELAKFFFQLIFNYYSDFKNIFPAPDFKYFSISLANGLLALIIDFAISKKTLFLILFVNKISFFLP